ncbi:hypothetical protein ACFUTY_37920 [Streptomyces sp. NPDC057362]|uniref:hypothetical protein n=1 Tax=Streptomyces sp. NPDC057362 TaxID=3346106 RepID=UPI00363B422E
MEHIDRTPGIQLSESEAAAEARRIIASLAEPEPAPIPRPTSYRSTEPNEPGTAAPVTQEGRPPMSQRATDLSGLMLAGSVASLSVGGATSLVLYTLGQVDPVTLAVGAAGPVALVLAVGSLIRSAGRAKADAHTEHHHHYNGSVRQETTNVSSTTRGLFAKNRNDVR